MGAGEVEWLSEFMQFGAGEGGRWLSFAGFALSAVGTVLSLYDLLAYLRDRAAVAWAIRHVQEKDVDPNTALGALRAAVAKCVEGGGTQDAVVRESQMSDAGQSVLASRVVECSNMLELHASQVKRAWGLSLIVAGTLAQGYAQVCSLLVPGGGS